MGEARGESAVERFWSSQGLSLSRVISWLMASIAITIPVFIIYRGFFGNIDLKTERSLAVCLFTVYTLLKHPSGRKKWSDPPNCFFSIDALLMVLTIAAAAYAIWGVEVWHANTSRFTVNIFSDTIRVDHLVGAMVIIITLEATRRAFGWVMPGLAILFILYSLFANYAPGQLRGAALNWKYLTEILYVLPEGVYGTGTDVLISMLFLFLLFGSLLVSSRVSAAFMGLANSLVGHYSAGPAKVSVVSSAFIGTVSGSSIANVATTGCVTIPMMKKMGFKPEFAGAVETCASTGGIFTPPVMGAAAFLIAIFTNTPYLNVCLYCIFPALLYYLGVFMQVHFRGKKDGLMGMPRSEIPSVLSVITQGWHLFIPFFVLIILMMMQYSVGVACVAGIVVTLLASFVRKETRFTPRSFLVALERATDDSLSVSMCLITVGIIVGAILTSGLGVRLTTLVSTVSMGNMFLGLILAAIISLILGMGINPTLIYLICLIFVIPALIEVGVPVMAAHLFSFLFAAAAGITPPVAMAAYTAAVIAGSPPLRTAWTACKLGIAAYLTPFALVYRPAILLMAGTTFNEMAIAVLSSGLGIACVAASIEGWLLRRCSILERLLLAGAGISLLAPLVVMNALGAVAFIIILTGQKYYYWGFAREAR